MIRSVIIDDELKSRNTLCTLLSRYCNNVIIKADADNVEQGITLVQQLKPELVFLDINMPGGDGFMLFENVKNISFEVIFVTAYSEYSLNAIKVSAIDYLLKPINISELQLAVQKAEERILEKRGFYNVQTIVNELTQKTVTTDTIAVPVNDGLRFIALNNIIRMKAEGSYTQIFCLDKTSILSSKPIKDYEELLPSIQFFRVHHSHVINLSLIKHYHRGDGGYVTMVDGSVVDISKRRKKDFLGLFEA
ncbi:MAG: response regulator transcription factor [Bacteroidetes bacterium]|nr:response regulator transcription factor [Bacteroidota bacterium]